MNDPKIYQILRVNTYKYKGAECPKGLKASPKQKVKTFVQKWADKGKDPESLVINPWHIPGFKALIGQCAQNDWHLIPDIRYTVKGKLTYLSFFRNEEAKKVWQTFKDIQTARKAAKFIPNPIDHKIRLLKKIMGSDIPMKFAHSILIVKGIEFAPKLFRMWETAKETIDTASYFKAHYLYNELLCGRDRKRAALAGLGIEVAGKDPNYVNYSFLMRLLEERADATRKDAAKNFYMFVKTSKKSRKYTWYVEDPYTNRRPAKVLDAYCKEIDDFTLGGDLGNAGRIASMLYAMGKDIYDGQVIFSTEKEDNTMRDLFPSELL